jgi:predicted transglutaminase-like cysteine proteinase
MRVWLTFAALVFLAVMVSGCASSRYDNLWALNKSVSHRFTYLSDDEKHGVVEFWEKGVTGDGPFSGDCEEYAFAIKYQLQQAGYQAKTWRVHDGIGGHAVTCTDDGYCLDHRRAPRLMRDTGYQFFDEI